MWHRKNRVIAPLLFVLATIILLRNLALDSPLMAGDEYAYFAAAQTFPDSAERFAFDPYLPRIYSPVFAAYGGLLASLSARPELLMKALNTVAFVRLTLLFLGLVKRLGAGEISPISAAVFLLLPASAYTAYFMPETTYAFLFGLLTWSMVSVLPTRILGGAVLSGAVVGTMLLVKPHALAAFLAVLMTLCALFVAPSSFRPKRRTLLAGGALFIVATYVTLVCVNATLGRQFEPYPLFFVGGIYRPYLSQGVSLSSWVGQTRELFSILSGHLIVFGALLAPAVALGIAHMRGLYTRPPSSGEADHSRDRALFILIAFAGMAALVTIGMTTNFTAQAAQTSPTEHLRLHGRYYSFVIPLYLVLFFGFSRDDQRVPIRGEWIRLGALVGCVMALLLYYLQGKRIIYPFDYPEAFVFSSWHGRTRAGLAGHAVTVVSHLGIAAAVVSYLLILWRGRFALFLYPWLLLALFSLSNVGVTAWQRANSAHNAALRADARAMQQLIPLSERNEGLVVGPEWNGPLAYVLFNLGSSARVLVREPGSVLTDADIPSGTRWVLLVGQYTPAFRSNPLLQTPRVSYIRVDAADPAAGLDRR